MRLKWKGLGLVLQFNLFVLALVVLTSAGVAGFICYRQLSDDWRHLLEHGRAIAEMAADRADYATYTRNPEELQKQLEHVGKIPEIAYVILLDSDHRPLDQRGFRGGQPGTGHPPPKRVPLREILTGKRGAGVIELEARIRGGSVDETGALLMESSQTVFGETIGYLRVGLGLTEFREDALRSLVSALEVMTTMLLFGMAITLYMTRRIIAPLRRLDQAVHAIADGRLETVRIDSGGPEISDLAYAFNSMIEKLREYRRHSEDHRQTLEQEVEQRTGELRAATLEAQSLARQAEAANQAKSQFLANVSHELRTPLNAILGLSNIVLKTQLNDKQHRFLSMVHNAGQTLLELINQILDLSKIEAGKVDLRPEDFDPHEAVEEIADLFAEQAEAKQLRLGTELAGNLPERVRGDRLRFQQILINLLGNAIKFTERGEITLRGRVAADYAETGRLCFEVEDTGIGIAPEDREQIFSLFSQLDSTSTRKYGGTGLGLAIVQQLVGMMDGSIEVNSEPGGGARFCFTLRFQPALEENGGNHDTFPLYGQFLLVVAAPGPRRDVLSTHLRYWRTHFVFADGPAAALAWLGQNPARRGSGFGLVVETDDDPGELRRLLNHVEPLADNGILLLAGTNSAGCMDAAEYGERFRVLREPYRRSQLLEELLATKAPAQKEETVSTDAEHGENIGLGARVLLAEDNLINQELAREMLVALGLDVRVVANGHEALTMLEKEHFDLLLLDCHMPELDGYQTAAEIRRREQSGGLPRLPIIAVTADAMPKNREHCLLCGMDDYLAKPFSSVELTLMLRSWLHETETKISELPESSCEETSALPVRLDEQVLDRIRSLQRPGAPNLLARVISMYLESSPALIAALRDGLQREDHEAVRDKAHNLKSTSANLGATHLAELVKHLEHLPLSGNGYASTLAEIETEYRLVCEELRLLLQRVEATGTRAGRDPGTEKSDGYTS